MRCAPSPGALRPVVCQARSTTRAQVWPCRFILKTDDDAFVNVPAFVQQLRLLCESPDCRRERLYMGKQCRRGKVILSPGHKWDNGAYYNHTGASLRTCPGMREQDTSFLGKEPWLTVLHQVHRGWIRGTCNVCLVSITFPWTEWHADSFSQMAQDLGVCANSQSVLSVGT